jgi:uncharacterized protein (DUF2225 family)
MTTMFPETFTCPVCLGSFENLVLGSSNTFGPLTSELRQHAAGFDPLEASVHTCPECGYSSDTDGFGIAGRSIVPSVPAVIADRVHQELTPLVAEVALDAARKFEFFARIGEWAGEPSQMIGDQYIAAAWCCDNLTEDAADSRSDAMIRAAEYRRLARAHFLKGLEAGSIQAAEQPVYMYLVGELSRRLGEDDCSIWFQRVIEDPNAVPFLQRLARQQMDRPQEVVDFQLFDR